MKRLLILIGLLLLLAAALAAAAWFWLTRPLVPELPAGPPAAESLVEVVIPAGNSARGVGQLLAEAGLPVSGREFGTLARLMGLQTSLKAGVYQLAPGDSLLVVMRKLSRGEATQDAITFIEGWTFAQMLRAVQAHPGIRQTLPFDREEAAAQLAAAAGLPSDSVEGYLFPDTYLFVRGSSDRDVLLRAIRLQRKVLAQVWESRRPGLPLESPEQALILASIIERETQHPPDRALVSSVFQNRLAIGMRLQSDPTTIYGLGDQFDGDLRRKDLQHDSPYNTYRVMGLPPTPIANPGRAALKAAVNPQPSAALYFVARGDGSSHFSQTLEEHNQAVNHFQRGRGSAP